MLLSEGQMSDYKGAAPMLNALPPAKTMLADRGYDADRFPQALRERGIVPCIPSKSNRKLPIPHDRVLYPQRHKIETMFGRFKNMRRIQPVMSLRRHLLLRNLHRSNRHLRIHQ
jgi:transposase